MASAADDEVSRNLKRQRSNSPPARTRKGIIEIDDGWDTDTFDYEIDEMIKLSGYEDNHDPKTREVLARYFGDVRISKGFDIENENDAPFVEEWMHPVNHVDGPEAEIIERCARVAVLYYNAAQKGKKILKLDKVVKATRAINCIYVYYITLEAKEESKNETTTYQARVNYHSSTDAHGEFLEGFDAQIFRPKRPQLEVIKDT